MNTRLHLLAAGIMLCLFAGVARADIVVIVSPQRSAMTLSETEIADIFLGKASRFPDGSQAVPIDQPENSAARAEFYARFADRSLAQVKMHWAKLIFTGRGQPPKKAAGPREMKALVANNPNAIGYIDRSEVDETVVIVETGGGGN